MLGSLHKMVNFFFFLRELIQMPTILLQQQSCIIPKMECEKEQPQVAG